MAAVLVSCKRHFIATWKRYLCFGSQKVNKYHSTELSQSIKWRSNLFRNKKHRPLHDALMACHCTKQRCVQIMGIVFFFLNFHLVAVFSTLYTIQTINNRALNALFISYWNTACQTIQVLMESIHIILHVLWVWLLKIYIYSIYLQFYIVLKWVWWSIWCFQSSGQYVYTLWIILTWYCYTAKIWLCFSVHAVLKLQITTTNSFENRNFKIRSITQNQWLREHFKKDFWKSWTCFRAGKKLRLLNMRIKHFFFNLTTKYVAKHNLFLAVY